MMRKPKMKQKRSATTQRIPGWLFFVTWVVMTGILFHAGVLISTGLDYYLVRLGIRLSVSSYLPVLLIPFGLLIAAQAFLLHLYAGWSAWRWLLISLAGLIAASLVEGAGYLVRSYFYDPAFYWLSSTIIYILSLLMLSSVQAWAMRDSVRRAWLWPLFMCGAFWAATIVNDLISSPGIGYHQLAEIAAYGMFAVISGAGMSYLLSHASRREPVAAAEYRVVE